jgi:hypothetical protein
MKKLFFILVFLLTSQIAFAQTKVDEYGAVTNDQESGRIDNFLNVLQQEPESKGLIVIYSGANKERLGNILAHIEGIKQYAGYRESVKNEISFVIAEGRNPLDKELWIVQKGEASPKLKLTDLNLNGLKAKYEYALRCLECEPSIPELARDRFTLALYIDALKKNENYNALITIENGLAYDENGQTISAKKFASNLKELLTTKGGIDKKRIKIRVINNKTGAAVAQFYIVPKIVKDKPNVIK